MNTRDKCERLARAYYGARDVPPTVAMVKTRKCSDNADYAWIAGVDGVDLFFGGGATEDDALRLLADGLRSRLMRFHRRLTDSIAREEVALAEHRAALVDMTMALDATEE